MKRSRFPSQLPKYCRTFLTFFCLSFFIYFDTTTSINLICCCTYLRPLYARFKCSPSSSSSFFIRQPRTKKGKTSLPNTRKGVRGSPIHSLKSSKEEEHSIAKTGVSVTVGEWSVFCHHIIVGKGKGTQPTTCRRHRLLVRCSIFVWFICQQQTHLLGQSTSCLLLMSVLLHCCQSPFYIALIFVNFPSSIPPPLLPFYISPTTTITNYSWQKWVGKYIHDWIIIIKNPFHIISHYFLTNNPNKFVTFLRYSLCNIVNLFNPQLPMAIKTTNWPREIFFIENALSEILQT